MEKFAKSALSVCAAVIVATAALIPVGLASAYGDNTGTQEGRMAYTLAQINAGILGDTITFNSIKDGKIGDERNFVGAKLTSGNASVYNANEINVEDGQTYTIRLYVHNNSPKGMEAIAKGVSVNFSLPTSLSLSVSSCLPSK